MPTGRGGTRREPPDALERCVGDPAGFLEERWATGPHLKRRAGDDDFADLLSLEHVDEILTTMSLRYPAFRLVRKGAVLPPSRYTRSGTVGGKALADLIDVGRTFDLFAEGATIVLQGLHRYWPPVARLARELETFLTHPVQANAYITPPVASGLRVHHDTHDVFALQTHGRKHWVAYDPVIERPLASQKLDDEGRAQLGEPVLDTFLEPGDCLYVPRGTPHAARTVDAPSVHLTIGIRQTTWHDVLRRVADRAADDVSFRRSLPAGYAHDAGSVASALATKLKEMAAWLEQVDAEEVAADVVGRFWRGRIPSLEGQLADILALDEVDDDTVVRHRPGVAPRLVSEDGRVVLHLGDRRVSFPAEAGPALTWILATEEFRVGDLSDHLGDEESRRVVVRRLVREGPLTLVR